MSECVVRMEMPHDGLCDLAFSFLDRTCCTIEGNLCNYCDDGVIPKWCPIICQLPKGHGRLGDLDKLEGVVNMARIRVMRNGEDTNPYWECADLILQAPTIVPADTAERSEA